jgi:hypothetical protein
MEHQHSESETSEHDGHQAMDMTDHQHDSMDGQSSEMMDMQEHNHQSTDTMTEQQADPHAGHMH